MVGQRLEVAKSEFPQKAESFNVVYVPPAYQGPMHCQLEAAALYANGGHITTTSNLDAGNVNATFDDDAEVVVNDFGDMDRIVVVSESRNFEAILRAVAKTRDKGRFVCGIAINSRGPLAYTFSDLFPYDSDISPHTEEFDTGIHDNHDGTTSLDPEVARKVIWHDVEDEAVVLNAMRNLRPQRRAYHDEASLPEWPAEVPLVSFRSMDDRTFDHDYTDLVDKHYFKGNRLLLPGGHGPSIARPTYLAECVIKFAREAEKLKTG